MAQHYPIEKIPQKRFRDIERIIRNEVHKSRGLLKTSMKYEYLYDDSENEVYQTNRRIPKGIVWGDDTRGSFEVHIHKKTHNITYIYFVA